VYNRIEKNLSQHILLLGKIRSKYHLNTSDASTTLSLLVATLLFQRERMGLNRGEKYTTNNFIFQID
jgi:hypothetical protein